MELWGRKSLLRKEHLGSNLSSELFSNCVIWGTLEKLKVGKLCVCGGQEDHSHLAVVTSTCLPETNRLKIEGGIVLKRTKLTITRRQLSIFSEIYQLFSRVRYSEFMAIY